jgi:hypothetical protein
MILSDDTQGQTTFSMKKSTTQRSKPAIQDISPRYAEWLQFVFDRPITPNGWYFDLEEPNFAATANELAALVAHTLENCGRDLVRFSNEQVYHGLNYIFSNSCSDVVFALMDESVPTALRLRAIASIQMLYRDCFNPRCAPVLGNIDEPGSNPLNSICYMLRYTSPLGYWENRPNKDVFYGAVVEVMAVALNSSNPACVESALHGLGHTLSSYTEKIVEIIDSYLRRNVFVSPQLKEYAQHAKSGCIQ